MNIRYFVNFIVVLLMNCNVFAQNSSESLSKMDSLYSNALNEVRYFYLYLPANYSEQIDYPVIYSTDGQMFIEDNYKLILDSLIKTKMIPPVVLVGAFSNSNLVKNTKLEYRFYEYVERDTKSPVLKERYDNHKDYFLQELPAFVNMKYKMKPNLHYSIFYGCSNGGDYGMSLINQSPQCFSHFICFSPVNTIVKKRILHESIKSKLYLAYGTEELNSIIGMNLKKLDRVVNKRRDLRIYVDKYNGGHEREKWLKEFEKALIYVFQNK